MVDQLSDLRVGIVGASNAPNGWAKISHVPAVRHLNRLRLTAGAVTNQESADAAAEAFGRNRPMKSPWTCSATPKRTLSLSASEFLVTVSWCSAQSLPASTFSVNRRWQQSCRSGGNSRGCHRRQNRCRNRASNPYGPTSHSRSRSAAIRRDRPIAERTNPFHNGGIWRRVSEGREVHGECAKGVTLITVQGSRTVDYAIAQFGLLADVQALATTQFPRSTIGDSSAPSTRTTPDHMLVQSRLASGSVLSLEVAGGRSGEYPFRRKAIGEKGVLPLEGGASRRFQAGFTKRPAATRQ